MNVEPVVRRRRSACVSESERGSTGSRPIETRTSFTGEHRRQSAAAFEYRVPSAKKQHPTQRLSDSTRQSQTADGMFCILRKSFAPSYPKREAPLPEHDLLLLHLEVLREQFYHLTPEGGQVLHHLSIRCKRKRGDTTPETEGTQEEETGDVSTAAGSWVGRGRAQESARQFVWLLEDQRLTAFKPTARRSRTLPAALRRKPKPFFPTAAGCNGSLPWSRPATPSPWRLSPLDRRKGVTAAAPPRD